MCSCADTCERRFERVRKRLGVQQRFSPERKRMCFVAGKMMEGNYSTHFRRRILPSAVLAFAVTVSPGFALGAVEELPPKMEPIRRQDGPKPATGKKQKASSHPGANQSAQVVDAEHRANFKTCVDGRYPALCKHSKLTPSERIQVVEAEKRANFKTCIDGRYPALCNHSKLTSSEKSQVLDAEKAANLKICMDGRYPALCNHSLLKKTDSRK